jgi:hypothetical protein
VTIAWDTEGEPLEIGDSVVVLHKMVLRRGKVVHIYPFSSRHKNFLGDKRMRAAITVKIGKENVRFNSSCKIIKA